MNDPKTLWMSLKMCQFVHDIWMTKLNTFATWNLFTNIYIIRYPQIYIHNCTHTHTHTHTHLHTHTYTHTHTTHTHTYIHTDKYTYTQTHTHTQTQYSYIHTHKHTHNPYCKKNIINYGKTSHILNVCSVESVSIPREYESLQKHIKKGWVYFRCW